jgi:hypothetical protein
LGYSRIHASDVPLILKLNTGAITPQRLCLENSTSIPIDDSSKPLQDDWLNAKERELKYFARQREQKIQETFSLDNSSLNNPKLGVESISLSGIPTQMVQMPQN